MASESDSHKPTTALHGVHSSIASINGRPCHIDSLIFLDLRISIGPDPHLIFQTYQKQMKMYLYIPLGSVHPPEKMLQSLIFGRLQAYWLQNTCLSDFFKMAALLICCLMAHGYSFPTLKPLFKESSIRLQA
jgi:hypothetical protein